MPIKNALHPTDAQFASFVNADNGEPIYMLNLLKFKETAQYRDGEQMSGREAYRRYAEGFSQLVSGHGVETIYSGDVSSFLIGEGEGEWDAAAIVKYPNASLMAEITTSDAYKKIHYHRRAGLEGQLLLACNGMGLFK